MRRELPKPGPGGLLVGVIVGAVGLEGEVKVKTFTAAPDGLGRYGPLFAEDGRNFTVVKLRALKADGVAVRFKGIGDRANAESLKGVRLYVARSALPELKQNEFYHADLVGLRVEDEEGALWGTVRAVHNFGAGDMIEIEDANGKTTMLPFTRALVPVIDVAGGRIIAVKVAYDE